MTREYIEQRLKELNKDLEDAKRLSMEYPTASIRNIIQQTVTKIKNIEEKKNNLK